MLVYKNESHIPPKMQLFSMLFECQLAEQMLQTRKGVSAWSNLDKRHDFLLNTNATPNFVKLTQKEMTDRRYKKHVPEAGNV